MSEAPIVIILQTYARTNYALRTIAAARQHLRYSGELLWYVADDGSDQAHLDAVLNACGPLLGFHSERTSYGANTNRAIDAAMEVSSLYLPLEDDWVLSAPFDLWRSADVLLTTADVGMVRFGYLNAGLSATLTGIRDRLYWRLDDAPCRDRSLYAFTGHPSLRHRRYHETHGRYPEGWQPGDTEIAMAELYHVGAGADIVWPAELGGAGPWAHIGAVQSYTWNGGVCLD